MPKRTSMATTCHAGSSKHPRDTRAPTPRRPIAATSLGGKLLPWRAQLAPAGHDMAPRLLPCRFEEVWRASAGRLDWIALAGMCLADCLARLWIKNARENFESKQRVRVSKYCSVILEIWVYWNRKLITLIFLFSAFCLARLWRALL